LSQLPHDLQEIKLKSAIKSS